LLVLPTRRNLREGDHLKDPSVNGKKILKWIFDEWDMGAWTGSV
jgi:hypothetical protein